jgi:hypothetical protein
LALAVTAALGACGGGGGGGLVSGGGGAPGAPVVIGSGGSGDTGAIGTIGGDDGGGSGNTGGGSTGGGGTGSGGGGGGSGGAGNGFGNWGSAPRSGAVVVNVSGLNPATLSAPADDPDFKLGFSNDSGGNTIGVTLTDPALGTASKTLPYTSSSGTVAYFEKKTSSNWTVMTVENPQSHGWQYQTFGEWATVDLAGDGSLIGSSFKGQGFSTGDVTPVGSMPHTGTATYTGTAAGYFVTGGNLTSALATRADVSATANFGTGSMSLSTINTKAAGINRSDLNFNGNLAITDNGFAGTVSHSGTLSGTAKGKFYGPHADEIGGAYNLGGSAGQLIGAFGAQK